MTNIAILLLSNKYLLQEAHFLFVGYRDCKLCSPFHFGRTIRHQRQQTDKERQGQNFVTLLQHCFKLCSSEVSFYVVNDGHTFVIYIYSLIKWVNGMRLLKYTSNKSFIQYHVLRKNIYEIIIYKYITIYKHKKIVRESI